MSALSGFYFIKIFPNLTFLIRVAYKYISSNINALENGVHCFYSRIFLTLTRSRSLCWGAVTLSLDNAYSNININCHITYLWARITFQVYYLHPLSFLLCCPVDPFLFLFLYLLSPSGNHLLRLRNRNSVSFVRFDVLLK